jgi:hypothetical protein
MLENIDGGALEGADVDLGAPTINIKKHRWRAPRPPWGSGPHPGCEGCAIILHGYDRQGVILLMGPTTLCLVLLWLTALGQITGHG